MAGKFDDATSLGNVMHRLDKVEKRVAAQGTSRDLQNSSVGQGGLRFHSGGSAVFEDGGGLILDDGGSITINGGFLRLRNENNDQLAFFGPSTAGNPLWQLSYPDGSVAIGLVGAQNPGFWAARDNEGNNVISNDSLTGVGLARPYLQYKLVPSFDAEGVGEGAASLWPSTASTTPVKVMQGVNPAFNPRVSFGFSTATTGGGSADWSLEANGVEIASGSGGSSGIVSLPGWGNTLNPSGNVTFDLYLSAGGGATRAWIQCDRLHGNQS